MTTPVADSIDLENQHDAERNPSPPLTGTTTLVDETSAPDSPGQKPLLRQWTSRLKQSLRSSTFSIPEKLRPTRYDENLPSIERIDFHPKGYPRLAAYINSDDNFMMCRRFGFMHTRVLLYRQDELRELEDQLIRLDAEDAECPDPILTSRILDDAQEGSFRKGLIQEIDDKLKEYDALVMRCRGLASLRQATTRNYNSLANWMYNEKPLSQEDSEFINNKEDFVALCDREEVGWFDGMIEDVLSKIPCKLTRLLFTTAEQRRKSDDKHIKYYSKSRINLMVRIIICFLAVILLVAPVVLLFLVQESYPAKVLVLLSFTLFFCVCISVFTKARRHDVFGATAA